MMLSKLFCLICRRVLNALETQQHNLSDASMSRLSRHYHYSLQLAAFALLFFVSSLLHAQPFLWKATGDHEFYLFGTIHLPDPRVTVLTDEVEQALIESDRFFAELDLSEENTMLIKQSMWLPEKENLHKYLSDELESEINHYLKSIDPKLNIEFFAKQKIWVLAISLTVLKQQLKYPGELPLDSIIFQRAVSLGLGVGGLETVEDQLYVFDSMPIEDQITFLQDTVQFMQAANDNDIEFIEESINAYLQGDLNILMNHLMSYMKDNAFYDDLLRRLITQRNKKMADKIVKLVSENTNNKFFFAVGAGHFWGPEGINAILMEKGYSVEAVK